MRHSEEITGGTLAIVYQLSLSGFNYMIGFGLHEIMIVINAALAGFIGAYAAHKAKKFLTDKSKEDGKE